MVGTKEDVITGLLSLLESTTNYYHGIYYIVLETDLSYYIFESHVSTIFNIAVNADQTR